jgi:spore coat polysaccharide biosynthesis protein SpsF
MSKIAAIIQARSGSTRLPAKTLRILHVRPLLGHIIERVAAARLVGEIVVATSTGVSDDPIEELARRMGVGIFRGSETDVLARYHGAASACGADVVVRVTADDPFKDPEIIDHAVSLLATGRYDYCSNTISPTFPEGIDIEVFTFEALDKAHGEAVLTSEREHVTPYIWKRPERFNIHNFRNTEDLSGLRWTIDYQADFEFAQAVYRRLYSSKRIFLMKDVLDLLRREPALAGSSTQVGRNEGYNKMLAKEKQK